MRGKFLIAAILLATVSFANPPAEEGKAIFTTRCGGCHNVNKTLTGPALAGIDQRRSMDWIINFVHSSQAVIKKGDKEAVVLFEKFNRIPMPDHTDLTSDHIKSIVEYIKSETKSSEGEKTPFARPAKLQTAYKPIAITDYTFFGLFLMAVLLLIGGLWFAVKVKNMNSNYSK